MKTLNRASDWRTDIRPRIYTFDPNVVEAPQDDAPETARDADWRARSLGRLSSYFNASVIGITLDRPRRDPIALPMPPCIMEAYFREDTLTSHLISQ